MDILFVIGIPGSRYEQIAATAAKQVRWQAVNVADQVAQKLGVSLETLHIYHDEEIISQLYHECFTNIIASVKTGRLLRSLVILPADIFDNPENLKLLKTLEQPRGIIFELNIQTLSQRIGLNKPRAVGLGAPRAILRQLILEKKILWESLDFSHLDANTENQECLIEAVKRFITNNSEGDFD